MKKLIIQTLTINVNNEKITLLTFEGKNEKYVLYALINSEQVDSTLFGKMEFKENLQITPKKRFNDLKFNIITKDNLFILLINNKPVYFLKNNKNINISDKNLKLILSNGSFYLNEPILKQEAVVNKRSLTISTSEKNTNLVDDILKKESKVITFSDEVSNLKITKEINTVNEIKTHNELGNLIQKVSESANEKISEIINEVSNESNIEIINEVSEVIPDQEVNETFTKTVSQEVNEIANKEVSETIAELVSQVVTETVAESVTEIVSEPIHETVNETVSEPVNETVSEPVNEIVNEPVNETVSETVSEIVNETVSETVNETVNETATETVNNSDELEFKKNKLDNDVFNLENILKDFNKLFSFVDKKDDIVDKKEVITSKNEIIIDKKENIVNKNSEVIQKKTIQEDKKINQDIQDLFVSKFVFQNTVYRINTMKIKDNNDLNFMNLYNSKVIKENVINKNNIAFQLEEYNSSYLILLMNQKYLINKVNNILIVTNLFNRTSQTVKNKDNFKIGLNDYMLYNNSTLIIPMNNQKIFDNSYGTSYNFYLPRL
jgi:hypothetical protein